MITERPLVDVGEPPDAIREWADRVIATWSLSAAQRKVCELILKGLTEAEIADALGMSLGSVKSHTTEIRKKARVDSIKELFAEILRL